MGTINCCKNCPDRRVGCHTDCKIYAEAVADNEALRRFERDEKEWRAYCTAHFVEQRRRNK